MKEILTIHNFGGIKDASIEINQGLTLIIGPQASGKSIIAKLLYFFKSITPGSDLLNMEKCFMFSEFLQQITLMFKLIFPQYCWPKAHFYIEYKKGDDFIYIKYEVDRKDIIFGFSNGMGEALDDYISDSERNLDLLSHGNRKQLFVVANRAQFAMSQDAIIQSLLSGESYDPITEKFLSSYLKFKKFLHSINQADEMFDNLQELIISAKLSVNAKGEDVLSYLEDRMVDIQHASTGQQETLPLIVFLKYLLLLSEFKNVNEKYTIYVEEPENHLFPSSQALMAKLISYVLNESSGNLQIVLTTHSPYIMTSFNNLIEAAQSGNIKNKEVGNVVPPKEWISKDNVSAYSIEKGLVENIYDHENGLISTEKLDAASSDILTEYQNIINA